LLRWRQTFKFSRPSSMILEMSLTYALTSNRAPLSQSDVGMLTFMQLSRELRWSGHHFPWNISGFTCRLKALEVYFQYLEDKISRKSKLEWKIHNLRR
jgi:hypothetical protein